MLCSLLLSGNTHVHIPFSLFPFVPVCIPLSPSSTFLSPISAPLWLSSAPPPPPSSPPPGPQLCPPCYYTPREEQSTVCFMVYWLTASYLVTYAYGITNWVSKIDNEWIQEFRVSEPSSAELNDINKNENLKRKHSRQVAFCIMQGGSLRFPNLNWMKILHSEVQVWAIQLVVGALGCLWTAIYKIYYSCAVGLQIVGNDSYGFWDKQRNLFH